MNWDKVFKGLGRINAVLFFLGICTLIGFLIYEAIRFRSWEQSDASYGEPGLADSVRYEGEEIEIEDGLVVKYVAQGEGDHAQGIEASNVSLTHMATGKSRLLLPEDSDQVVLRFEELSREGERSGPARAYMVLAGSEADYEEGILDLIVGRFDDLEQQVVARRVRFVDSPRLIDADTLSLIVWPTSDRAEFWLLDLNTFERTLSRKVEVPLPDERGDEISEAVLDFGPEGPIP